MFYYLMPWFYKKFRSENLSVLNTGPGTRDHVKSSQRRNETSLSDLRFSEKILKLDQKFS